jgi:NTP pyrophosphatase (non-canonical NTP hydrolase)
MNIGQLSVLVNQFVDERDWHQFHTPKNLAMAISTEANELLEVFLWKDDGHFYLTEIAEELADVIIYCLAFANATGLDISEIVKYKITKNRIKYPVNEWKGKAP